MTIRLSSPGIFWACAALFFLVPAIHSQSDEPVHLTPRRAMTVQGSPVPKIPGDLKARLQTVRVDVDLALVPVTVTDRRNRPVAGLEKQNFKLYEGAQPQEVRYFSTEDAPISIGLIVDLSGSMEKKIDAVHAAVDEFFNNANPKDDYFVVTVSDTPKVLGNSTQSIGTIQEKLASVPAGGFTALLDAIYLAEVKLRSAQYQRRALLIISDGADNVSRYNLREIRSLVQEGNSIIYAIGLFDGVPVLKTLEEKFGKHLLTQITDASGGRTVSVSNIAKLTVVAANISRELRSQYILGYRPAKVAQNGKWRRLKVVVSADQSSETPLQAYYKKGYEGPPD